MYRELPINVIKLYPKTQSLVIEKSHKAHPPNVVSSNTQVV